MRKHTYIIRRTTADATEHGAGGTGAEIRRLPGEDLFCTSGRTGHRGQAARPDHAGVSSPDDAGWDVTDAQAANNPSAVVEQEMP